MRIQDKWMAYCEYEPRYATQDDWFHFVNEIYTNWLAERLKNDPKYDPDHFQDCHNYIEREYGFDVFIETAPEFVELRDLEPLKFELAS